MDYEYKDQQFSVEIAEALLSRPQVSSTGAKIETIRTFLLDYHLEQGGFGLPDSEDEEDDIFDSEETWEISIVVQALQNLSKKAKASHIHKDIWRIAKADQWIFGTGGHWVYLYYLPEDKKNAESKGKSIWQCRIGATDGVDKNGAIKYKAPDTRVENQMRSYRQKSITALLIRADRHLALETAIQKILFIREREVRDAPGDSWYWTNPSEVVRIVYEIKPGLLSPVERVFSFL